MPLNASYVRAACPEVVEYDARILGTGAADPTREIGADAGVTVTRQAAGVYRFAFDHSPGKFLRCSPVVTATTPANVKNYSAVPGDWDSTNNRIEISIFNAAGAATDLAAAQFLQLGLRFARTAVAG